jgi:hypothetical protein
MSVWQAIVVRIFQEVSGRCFEKPCRKEIDTFYSDQTMILATPPVQTASPLPRTRLRA